MPDPANYSSEEEFMHDCVPMRIKEGDEQDQAVAVCMNIWKEKKSIEPEEIKVAAREDVNPESGEHKYGDVQFADEKNKKYPIDTEEHIRAAWNYINKADNAAKYSAEDVATIKRRIVAAWKEKIDKAGPPSAQDGKSIDTSILVEYGAEVKALGNGKVGGYLVRYSTPDSPDLEGDYFTKDTDFGEHETLPIYYQHGMDEVIGKRKLGKGKITTDDVGTWIEAQLNLRDEYEKAIYQLAEQGKLGWSSGTAGHLVEWEQKGSARWLKSWPLGDDASLTPTPAEPRNSVYPLKSLSIDKFIMPDPKGETETATAEITNISQGDIEMAETKELDIEKLVSEASEQAAKAAVADFASKLTTTNSAGFLEVVKAEEDQPFPELKDMLTAVKVATLTQGRSLAPRLKALDIKQLGANELIGSEGGFLLEPQFAAELLKPLHEEGPLSSRARSFPIGPNSNGLTVNAVDETSRATGSRWGGIRGYRLAEAGTKTASQPAFRQMALRLKKFAVLCYATDELLEDSTALASVIQQGASEELSFMVNDDIMNGLGVSGPLGILNSGALISVGAETGQAADTIVIQNIYKMWSRLSPRSKANAVWYVNTDVWPQLFDLNQAVGVGGVPMFMQPGGLPNAPAGAILGRPVVETEFSATLGDQGDIMLADMSQYFLIEKGGVQQASSIHVQFLTDQTVFRFVYRVDGQPAIASPLTPYKGSNTQGPFVVLDARA